ncbi:MAG: scyllo-inositol 2-dehydrogenase [Microbacteriaceae bacterium]|nr:scyllo-inositol 2-dehydrogenase [Microbacteriaceae bacterium]
MVTIAIVGPGYMGRTHAEAWSNLGYADGIRYVVGRSLRAPFEHAPSARFVTDFEDVLLDREVDVVSICTPTPTHADYAIRALRAGKHVLLEKPIALTIDDAIAIREAARQSGRVLMVAHVVRFFAGYELLRQAWESGEVGRVLSARAIRMLAVPTETAWLLDESQSGGAPVDVAIHDFDQVNLFLGTPVAVTATRLDPAGPIETTIEYRDGGIGQVLTYTSAPIGVPFTSALELIGTRGVASYRLSAVSATEASVTEAGVTGAQGTDVAPSDVNTYRLANADGSIATVVTDNQPYTRQVEYFLSCIASKSEPILSPTDAAIAALEVSLATRESLASGRRIELRTRVSAQS